MATLGAGAISGAYGLSWAGTFTPGVAAGTGTLVGGGFVAMSMGVGLLVVGGLIDAKVTSKLFGGGKSEFQPPKLIGLPVSSQQAGEPRIWAIGRRVRVPAHVLWQSEKVRESGSRPGKGGAPPVRQVVVDCAIAVNDRETQRITQLIGQGKLIFWTTRNIVTVRTHEMTAAVSGGSIVLTMDSVLSPDWADKFEVADVVALSGFVITSGPNINTGYWKVSAVVAHTSTPGTITVAPYSGQTVAGLNVTAGGAAAPAEVTRVDDALVEHSWTATLLAATNAPNYPGTHDPVHGIAPGSLLLAGVSTHPSPNSAFAVGDLVNLIGFAVGVASGPPQTLTAGRVQRVTSSSIELAAIGITYEAQSVTCGTSTNASAITFRSTPTTSQGLFPSTFVPADYYHTGSETQTAGSIIEASGADPSGYRGIAYQELDDFAVYVFGNQLPPQLEALIDPDRTQTWAGALSLVCERAGIPSGHVDTSGVDPVPFEGMYLRGPVAGATALQPMLLAGQIATQERDEKLCFFNIDNAETVQIENGADYSDLGAHVGGRATDDKLAFEDMAEEDLPTSVVIRHQDPDGYYAEGAQPLALRNPSMTDRENRQEIDLSNIVLTRKQASTLAGTLMQRAYLNSRVVRCTLPASYLHVLENDLLTVTTDDGDDLTFRVIRRDVGANFLVQVTGVIEETGIEVAGSPVQSGAGRYNSPPTSFAPITGRVLDIPPLTDDTALTPGLIIAGAPSGGGNWAGCTVYKSVDAGSNWYQAGVLSQQCGIGLSETVLDLADASEALGTTTLNWDTTGSIDVEFDSVGTIPIVTITETDVLNGFNWFLLRDATTGRIEIIGARDVVQNTATNYTLSHLLRGLRGTIAGCAEDWPAGVEVTAVSFIADNGGQFVSFAGLESNTALEFRFVPPGKDVTDVESVELTATWRNASPFPVRDITKTINAGNDVRFTVDHWTRRNLAIGSTGPYPQDETYETYRFDLYDVTGNTLFYTRTASSQTTGTNNLRDKWAEFTSAEITLAGYTPGPSETFWIDVRQVGDYGSSPSVLQEL